MGFREIEITTWHRFPTGQDRLATTHGVRSAPTRSAFTLIELLIVITIIASLIAILLPVLGRARASGRMTVCATNLRQIGVGLHSYMRESGDILPYASFMPSMGPFPLKTEDPIYIADVLETHVGGQQKVFKCPDDTGGEERPEPNVNKSYFDSERSSYEYRFRLGGRSMIEAVRMFAEFSGRNVAESMIWLLRDYTNFHGAAGSIGSRRYLYSDDHVSDYEN